MPINIQSSLPVNLSDLHDVSISNPQTAQYLRYNGGTSEWQNVFLDTDVYNYLDLYLTSTEGIVLTKLSGPQTINIGLATVNADVGTYGSASAIPIITVDPQGRITAVSTAVSNFVVGTTTIYNTSYGDNSLINNVENFGAGTGIDNTANGTSTLQSNTDGTGNTGIGASALEDNTVGDFNTALGYHALQTVTGSYNTGIGANAGALLATGNNNVILGGNQGGSIVGTDNNVIISDGTGNVRIAVDSTGQVTIPGTLILTYEPTQPYEAATKLYVDNIASGINVHQACVTSTTSVSNLSTSTYNNGASGVGATLTAVANGAIGTVGGYAVSVIGTRILVKDQLSAIENGMYEISDLGSISTPWVLTRTTDFDGSPAQEIQAGDSTYIQDGTLGGTQWVQISIGTGMPGEYILVGTDPINFTQFSGAGTYIGGTGIDVSSNIITNIGVTDLIAGSNISLSSATGSITISTTGVVPSSTTSANLAGGSAGDIPYQTSANNTSMLSAGTTSQVLISGTTPSWTNTPTLTGTNFTGIPNAGLLNSSFTLGSTSISLGGIATTVNGLSSVTSTTFVGALTGNASSATTSVNISAGVAGNIPYQTSAGVTAMIATGTSAQVLVGGAAPLWTNTPTLTGTNFSGIPNSALTNNSVSVNGITINLGGSGTVTAAAGTLTGTTLAANVVSSSLTSVGTLTSLTVSGTATAAAFNATSTKRVKKAIKKLSSPYLEKFSKLQPREYDRKDYDAHEFGFIAEEMALIYPEIVGKDSTGKPSGIDYGKLSTILTAKIQDQQQVIESLQAQVSKILSILKV